VAQDAHDALEAKTAVDADRAMDVVGENADPQARGTFPPAAPVPRRA